MKISHRIAQELLEAEIDGRLTLDQEAALREHLSECAECREAAGSLHALDRSLAPVLQARYPQTPFSGEELDRRILAVRSKIRRQSMSDRLTSAARSLAWAGGLVVFAVLVALAIGTRPGQPGSILPAGRATATPTIAPTEPARFQTPEPEGLAAYPLPEPPGNAQGEAYPVPAEPYPYPYPGPVEAYPQPDGAYPLPNLETSTPPLSEMDPYVLSTGQIPCESTDNGYLCQDDFINLRFFLPFELNLQATLEKGEAGFSYVYTPDNPDKATFIGGGLSRDYAAGREMSVSDFWGIPDNGPIEEACERFAKENFECTEIQKNVLQIVTLPSAEDICNPGPRIPGNYILTVVDFPDDYLLGGLVFGQPLLPMKTWSDFTTNFSGVDINDLESCNQESMQTFDAQMKDLLDKIQSGTIANKVVIDNLVEMQRLAESIEILPVEAGSAESKAMGTLAYDRQSSPGGGWTASTYTFFPPQGNDRGEYYTQLSIQNKSDRNNISVAVDEWRPMGLGYTTPATLRWDEDQRYLYYTNLPHPDGCALMVNGSGLQRFDLETGDNIQLAPDQGMRIALSPDAGSLAYISYGEPNLVVRDLRSGEEKRVSLPPAGFPKREFQAGGMVWSPDGSSLALTLALDPCGTAVPWSGSVIIQADAVTLEMETLLEANIAGLQTTAWAEPGTIVLQDAEQKLYRLDPETGDLQPQDE